MPGLSLGLRPQLRQELGLRQKLGLRQELKLTLGQKLKLGDHQFALRLDLLGSIREERYEPKATCPRCDTSLTPGQIIKGFRRDPTDFTTKCVSRKCGQRFQPSLICFPSDHTRIELPFFCGSQTLGQMQSKGLNSFSPREIARREPAIYRAAIIHHGTLRKAFEGIGIQYSFEEVPEWRTKVLPFLGKMPDGEIAECAGVAKEEIAVLRSELKVKAYTKRKGLANAVQASKAEAKTKTETVNSTPSVPSLPTLTDTYTKLRAMVDEFEKAKALVDDPLFAKATEIVASAEHMAAFKTWRQIEKILAP